MFEYFKIAVTEKYADFDGRASRSEYWYFKLVTILIYFTLFWLLFSSFPNSANSAEGATTMLFSILGLMVFTYLALIIPSIAVTARRLHDTGRSGWLYLIAFIPFGGLVLFVFMCTEGHPGLNEYGPNPYELDAGDDISGHLLADELV